MRVRFVGTIPATWTFLSFQFLCIFTIALYFAIACLTATAVMSRRQSRRVSLIFGGYRHLNAIYSRVFLAHLIVWVQVSGVRGRMFSCSAFFYVNIENIWSISTRHTKGCHSASIDTLKYIKMSLAQPRHYLHLIAFLQSFLPQNPGDCFVDLAFNL